MAVPQAVTAQRIRDSVTKASRLDLSPDLDDPELEERAKDKTALILNSMNRDTLPSNEVEARAVEAAVLKLIKFDLMRDAQPDNEDLHDALNSAEESLVAKFEVDAADNKVDDDLGKLGGGVVGGST